MYSFLDCNSNGVKDLMEHMLEPDEEKRFKIDDVLQHSWLECHADECDIKELATSSNHTA